MVGNGVLLWKQLHLFYFSFYLLLGSKDITISCINDGNNGAVVKLTTGSSKSSVVSVEVVNGSLGKHGKVFQLGLAKWRAVGGDQDHLGLSLTKSLERGLVSQGSLSRLHYKLDSGVDAIDGLLNSQEKDIENR